MGMLKKPTVLLVVVLAGAWLAYQGFFALVSDETQITWLIEGMAEDFNDAAAGAVGKGLSADFVEETHGLGRGEIVLGLTHVMRQERRSDGTFPLRAHLLGQPQITLHDTDPRTADISVRVEFSKLPSDSSGTASPKVLGVLKFEGKCTKEGGDWRVVKSDHEILSGSRPF